LALREQQSMFQKKEEYLQKKIDEDTKKAKINMLTNKAAALAALRRKKQSETELERLAGMELQVEMQINTLESANLNAETMAAVKKAATALKDIHSKLPIKKVDDIMGEIERGKEIEEEIREAMTMQAPDDSGLLEEWAALEQEVLNDRLMGADHVPIHQPSTSRVEDTSQAEEDEEEAQLKELQAALAM